MTPADTNAVLIWILRIAYPLTLIILWHQWLPGGWFGLYLGAASMWAWVYDADSFWLTVLPSLITGFLKAAATHEILRDFFYLDLPQFRGRIFVAFYAAGMLGAVAVLGLHSPGSAWNTYSLFWACLNCGLLAMLITGLIYVRMDGMRTLAPQWWHALVWLAYLLRDVAGILVNVGITEADSWWLTANWIHAAALVCLGLWVIGSFRFQRREALLT